MNEPTETKTEARDRSAGDGAFYCDATFRSPAEDYGFTPGSAVYDAAEPKTEKKKKSSGLRLGGIIALCLCCSLAAGVLSVIGTLRFAQDYISDALAEAAAETAAPQAAEEVASDAPDSVAEAAEEGYSAPAAEVSTAAAEPEGDKLTAEQIYTLACRQVVGVNTAVESYNIFGQSVSSGVNGSGFFISADGYVLTNYHVVEEAYENNYSVTVLTYNGEEYRASIVGVEEDNDLAVLYVEGESDTPCVSLGDVDEMAVGQTVYTVGNPLGELSYTMTSGIVSALNRTITTEENITVNMFQIDAAVNSGNSGGPVYDEYGRVIGVVTAKYSSTGVEGIGFAIPVDDAYHIAQELIQNGYVSGKASLGITVATVSASVAQYYGIAEGAFINEVTPDSCAERAGLQNGDIITALDDTAVSSASELVTLLKTYTAGETVAVEYVRGGAVYSVQVVLDEEVPERLAAAEAVTDDESDEDKQYYYYNDAEDIIEDFFEMFSPFSRGRGRN